MDECNSELFAVSLAKSSPLNYMRVSINAPTIEYRSEYIAKLTMFDSIIFMLGLFGLWFGLSFTSLFDVSSQIIITASTKPTKPKINNLSTANPIY